MRDPYTDNPSLINRRPFASPPPDIPRPLPNARRVVTAMNKDGTSGKHLLEVHPRSIRILQHDDIVIVNGLASRKSKALAGYSEGEEFFATRDEYFDCSEEPTNQRQPPQPRKPAMNLKSIVAIADEQATTVSAQFVYDPQLRQGAKPFLTFKVPLDLGAQKDDYLIANSASGLTIIRVVEVHEDTQIEPDSDIEYFWAFQKVDLDVLTQLQDRDAASVKTLQNQRKKALRNQVIEAYKAGDLAALENLSKKDGEEF